MSATRWSWCPECGDKDNEWNEEYYTVREDYELFAEKDGLHLIYRGICQECEYHIEYKLEGVGKL